MTELLLEIHALEKRREAVKAKFKLHSEQLSPELDEEFSQADRTIAKVKWKER